MEKALCIVQMNAWQNEIATKSIEMNRNDKKAIMYHRQTRLWAQRGQRPPDLMYEAKNLQSDQEVQKHHNQALQMKWDRTPLTRW